MKFCLLIFFIALFSYKAEGKRGEPVVWLKPAAMPFKEFTANIKALGLSHISYAQRRLAVSRRQAQSFQLKEKLIPAQEFYLSGEENRAKKAFQDISRMALQADWNEEERRIIVYAFLRQAQMERRPEQRAALLLSAAEFTLFKINSLDYPDRRLFPPPLLKEIQLLQEKTNSLAVDWNKLFPMHEILLINGQKIEKNEANKIPQAFYRISAFSSSHESWSQNKSLSEILTETIQTKALTKGFCASAKIRREHIEEHTRLMPLSDCGKTASLNMEKNIKTKRYQKEALKKVSPASPAVNGSGAEFSVEPLARLELSKDFTTDIKKLDLKKQNKLSELSPWIAAGAGVVALVVILSLNQDQKVKKGVYVY